ncbi:hypothetical protein [Uliginosibacterium sediminicola]|uniref:Baseplate assembly protein n=1 Tax=Uliginosibacterium sediminicola TaxID=2024550 RepID=A0ABU9YW16_9RHOO
MSVELYPGRWPAVVKSYEQDTRMCRVEIPGITDGADVLPLAEIEYPIGDKSRNGRFQTEIEILSDDPVWVSFIGGDPRYPIITGYRNPQSGNSVDWRRWHHTNMELLAEMLMNMIAGEDIVIRSKTATVKIYAAEDIYAESLTHVTIKAPEITNDAPLTNCTGNLQVAGVLSVSGEGAADGQAAMDVVGSMKISEGGVVVEDGDVVAGDVSLRNHDHEEHGSGGGITSPPRTGS